MDRAATRAALLLRGFKAISKFGKPTNHLILVNIGKDWGYIHVLTYPCWFIGVGTIYGTKNFISAKKAWRYINQLLEQH